MAAAIASRNLAAWAGASNCSRLVRRATTLRILEIGSPLLEFRTKNLGTLIEAGILNRRRCRYSEQLGKTQMLLRETRGDGMAQGEQPQSLARRDQWNANAGPHLA